MPNWCSCRATVSGPAPVIKEITDILNEESTPLLAWMVPQPQFQGDQDWYQWNVNNWGTKWDVTDVYFEHQAEEDQIQFSFSTAWGPPVEAFTRWAESDGRVQFTLEYWEPGMGFVGKNYAGDDECYEYSNAEDVEDIPEDLIEEYNLRDQFEDDEEEE